MFCVKCQKNKVVELQYVCDPCVKIELGITEEPDDYYHYDDINEE